MKWWGRALLVGLFLTASVIPAATAGPGKPVRGGVLRQALDSEVLTLDPAFCRNIQDRAIIMALYDSLMTYNPDTGKLALGLAQTVRLSDDGLVFRVGLRKGVRFHNGREMKASDVKYTLDRVADPRLASPGRTLLTEVEGMKDLAAGLSTGLSGVRVIDDYTLQITLTRPSVFFLAALAEPVLSIVPGAEAQEAGDDFGKRPCGTGPFKIGEFAPNKVTVVRNERYWRSESINPAGLSWTLFGSAGEAFSAFVAGNLDVIYLTAEGHKSLKALGKWDSLIQTWPSPVTFYFGFNLRQAPFDKLEVRQAVYKAFDPFAYLKMHGDDGIVAEGILPPGVDGFDPGRRRPECDLEAARKLLAEAGFPGGRGFPRINLYGGNEGAFQRRLLGLFKSQLESLGLQVEIRQVPPQRYEESVLRDAHIFSYGWSSDFPDPHNFLYHLFAAEAAGLTNLTGYRNARVDALLERGRRERDTIKRAALYRQAEDLIAQDCPVIPVFHPTVIRAFQPYVKGCAAHPAMPFFYSSVWLDKH